MTMDYGDEYLDEITAERAASGPRHARPRRKLRVPALVRRMAFWVLVFGTLYAVAAVTLAVHPPACRLDFPRESPSAPAAHSARP